MFGSRDVRHIPEIGGGVAEQPPPVYRRDLQMSRGGRFDAIPPT
jgi:hypothetical protein